MAKLNKHTLMVMLEFYNNMLERNLKQEPKNDYILSCIRYAQFRIAAIHKILAEQLDEFLDGKS